MSEQIASLIVGIDSSSAVAARKDLDALTDAGTRTEGSAKRAGRAWIDSIERVAAETSGLSSKFDTLNGTQGKLLAVVERMAASLDRMSAAYARNAGQTSAVQQAADMAGAAMNKLNAAMTGAADSAGRAGAAAGKASADVKGLGESGERAASGLETLAAALGGLVSTSQLLGTIKSVTVDASRYEQVGLVMNAVGKNSGYARGELASLQNELQKTGISMTQSRETISRMVQANMDLSQATQLARLAQDAATIGNISSSEALQRMMQGIQSAEVEVLRGIGLNVNFEQGYRTLAATLGKTTESLSEQEKMQARTNVTMAQAPALAGSYEVSMTNAGKQALSLSRHLDDLSVKIGAAFQPAYLAGVQTFTAAVKLAQDNATLASVAIASVAAGIGVLTVAMVASTGAAKALGLALVAASANPVVLAIAAVGAAIGALIALHGSAAAKANEAGASQESAAQVALAGAAKLEAGINGLIEKYRQLGIESKKAVAGAFTAAEYSSQVAKIETDLQRLSAQRTLAQASFSAAQQAQVTPGQRETRTIGQMWGSQGAKNADANFQAVTDLERLDYEIRLLRRQKDELEKSYQGAVSARFDNYVNDTSRMTKAEEMTFALETAEKEFMRVTDGMDKTSDRYVAALKRRDTEMNNIRDRYKEKAGPKGAAVPLDYSVQIQAIEQSAKAESDILARAARDNEAAYQVGLKGAAQYYETKGELATQAAVVTANAASDELAVIEGQIASGKGTAAERRKLEADRVKAAGEASRTILAVFEAEKNGADELTRYWLGFQKGWTEAAESTAKTAEDQAQALRDQIDQYGMSKGAIADLVAVRAREDEAMARTQLAMAIMQGKRQEEIALIEREVAALGRRADALADSAGSTHELDRLEAQDKFTEEAKRQNEQIGDSLTDALLRGFEDGRGFGENFVKTLKNMFATLVLKPILQPVAQGAASYITDALGLTKSAVNSVSSTASGGAQSGSSGQSGFGMSFGDMAVKGLSALTSGSLGGEGIMGTVAKYVAGNTAQIAQVADFAGSAMMVAGSIMSAMNGDFGAAIGSAIGAYFGGPIGSFIGSKIGGLLDGPKTKPGVGNYGIADVTSSGINSVEDDSFFYGDRRGYKGVAPGLVNATQGIAGNITGLAARYGGDSTGLRIGMQTAYSPDGKGANAGTVISRDGVAVFGTAIEGANADLEKNAALVIERSILGGLQQSNIAPQFANVLRDANITEATQEQIDALKEQLELIRSLNVAFDAMNHSFPQLAETTWDAREAIVAAAGGLDAFGQQLNSYQQGYYTEAERMTASLGSMRDMFRAMGVEDIPTTRAGFRALMEDQDLATVNGQQVYATLLGMSDAFGTWADYTKAEADKLAADLKVDADKIAEKIKSIITAARSAAETAASGALSALTRSVNAQKNLITEAWRVQQQAMQEGIDAATTSVTNLKGLSDRLKSTLNTMFGQADAAMQRAQAQAQISGALATARAGGGLPTADSLENALGVVAQPSQELFATFEDYQLDFLKTANDIAALGQLTDTQLSIEERTLAALKDQLKVAEDEYDQQIKYYDDMLETAQAQLDAALGNSTALLTVAQALEGLRISLASLGASKPPASTNGAPAGLSSTEQAVWDAYNGSGIGYLDAGGWNFWNEAIKNGADPAAIAAEIAAINAGKNAINGSHAGGLWSVPFDGYRAELHSGETVLPAPEARAYRALQDRPRTEDGNSAAVVAELRALRQEVQGLRDEARATAQHTAKTAKTVTRWDAGGMPETREETTS
jgi:hypothetical protein